MKKIVKLTESELIHIIKKMISEQKSDKLMPFQPDNPMNVKSTNNQMNAKSNDCEAKINPYKLKFGDGGKKSPDKVKQVRELQFKLHKLGLLRLKNPKRPTGYFGNNTQAALQKYLSTNCKNTKNADTQGNDGFALVWAFPEYEPKLDGQGFGQEFLGKIGRLVTGGEKEGTYGKLGHGGVIIVTKNGDCTLFEFGRYPGAKEGMGKVREIPLGKIAKIVDGKLTNAAEVAKKGKRVTYPPGPSMSMTVAVVGIKDTASAISYAKVKERKYSAMDFVIGNEEANCGTFTLDVVSKGGLTKGIMGTNFCFPSPISAVNAFSDSALEPIFTV